MAIWNGAPVTGAWIEISEDREMINLPNPVAPFTGAWIEIWDATVPSVDDGVSRPSRARGLKYRQE